MLEHLFIRAPVVMRVLVDINNRLSLLRARLVQQRAGGEGSGSGGQKSTAGKSGVHAASFAECEWLAMGKYGYPLASN